MLERRNFVAGVLAGVLAPAVIRSGVLMPVRTVPYIVDLTRWAFWDAAELDRVIAVLTLRQDYV